jgi:hypothetical protein
LISICNLQSAICNQQSTINNQQKQAVDTMPTACGDESPVRNKKAVGESTHGLVTVSSVYRATGAPRKGKASETPLAIRVQNMP